MKRLSEFDLSNCIYMSVGNHVGQEPFPEILGRKMKEVEVFGWSLWAYSTNRKLDFFCKEYGAYYVVMSHTGKDVCSNAKQAKVYCVHGQLQDIPEGMIVTYGFNRKKAQALYVEEYYLIDSDDNIFEKSAYETPDGYVGIRDIWPLIKKEMINKRKRLYEICVVAKLKPPYSVEII